MARARDLIRDLLSAAAFALVVASARSSLADHYVVPTGSMLPTVHLGDHVVVDKLAYGLRVPFSHLRAPVRGEPARGDVVVLESPEGGTTLLKRVVAVPGDRVAVRDGRLELNGKSVPVALVGGDALETLGGKKHELDLEDGGGPDMPPITLDPGKYLVLGDHRGDSRDGRFFGVVDRSAILGRAVAICWREGRATWISL